jgi:hypothetical protein
MSALGSRYTSPVDDNGRYVPIDWEGWLIELKSYVNGTPN